YLYFKDGRTFERFSAPMVLDDSTIGRVWSFRDITERKLAVEALQKSEEAYRALFYESKDAMMTLTPDEGFLSGNHETIRMFGCSDEMDFTSRSPAEMSPEYQPDGALSSDKADEMMMLALNSGVNFFEWTHKCIDGTEFPATVLLSRIEKDGKVFLQATVRDITERKQAEEALRASQQLIEGIINSMPVRIFWKDRNSVYLGCNKIFANDAGFSDPKDIIGKDDFQMGWLDQAELYRSGDRQVMESGCPILYNEEPQTTPEGNTIILLTNKIPLQDSMGEICGILGTSMDITDRIVAVQKIELKNEELQKLNAEKDKFFSIIAHDLRSPFSSFLGLTQIMAEELPSLTMAQVQELAISLEHSASNLYSLLENLLQWARMQQGLISFNPEEIQLHKIAAESIASMMEPAKNKGIDLVYDISTDIKVVADSNMLQTVIRNLISNAVKFTNKGGEISLLAKTNGESKVEISIRDTGIGMNKVLLDKLFRLDEHTSRPGTNGEPSTGLGLLLCKEFIEKLGGKIWVESEEGKGSDFKFTIPTGGI
ncbi:MAG TPA: PAS domain-containing sensor histidine kinase, partial [Prolixibacteraceae bacterium]